MYQALYRKYRPRSFSDVAGQAHITETLREQMKNDRLSHAYLFVGSRGTGKTTCAKILSRAVNCQTPVDGDACNICESCKGIENGSILDVLELDAASNNGVDNIRALREEAVYTPALVKKRIYIVDEVHMLSTSAFNALLKILEEPPEHLIFILATTELHKVPATIMSRCQRFMFRRISQDAISARLDEIATKEKITLTEDASKKLAILADGSMRDAISLFDQCAAGETVDVKRVLDTIGLAGAQEISRLAGAIANRDINSTLAILDELYDNGRDMLSLLNELGALMRDLLVYNLSANSPLVATGRDRDELAALSKNYTSERLFFNLELIREAAYNLTRSGAMKLTTQMCLIRMCDERLSDGLSALVTRVARLESNSEFGIRNSELAKVCHSERSEESLVKESPAETGDLIHSYDKDDPQPSLDKEGASAEAGDLIHSYDKDDPQPSLDKEGAPTGAGDLIHSNDKTDNSELNFWSDILEHLKSEPSIYPVVSNKDKVWVELHDDHIIIYASDPFTVNQLEMDMFINPIKEATKKAMGRETIIHIKPGTRKNNEENKPDKPNKLDSLRAFGNVKFEE